MLKEKKTKIILKIFTLVPIDKDLINPNLLNKIREKWLNDYHDNVFKVLRSHMNAMKLKI